MHSIMTFSPLWLPFLPFIVSLCGRDFPLDGSCAGVRLRRLASDVVSLPCLRVYIFARGLGLRYPGDSGLVLAESGEQESVGWVDGLLADEGYRRTVRGIKCTVTVIELAKHVRSGVVRGARIRQRGHHGVH